MFGAQSVAQVRQLEAHGTLKVLIKALWALVLLETRRKLSSCSVSAAAGVCEALITAAQDGCEPASCIYYEVNYTYMKHSTALGIAVLLKV